MDAVLRQHVLVLNKNWHPINVTSVFDAIASVFSKRAKFIDPETYQMYDFEGWISTWGEATGYARVAARQVISCPNVKIVVPEIIVCTEYRGVGHGTNFKNRPKFSRRNIFMRDKHTCCYCGHRFEPHLLNIDHVIPRAQGGHSTWTNVVLSCIKCNDKKRDRTPEEAGMKLLKKPYVPTCEEVRRPLSERLRKKVLGDVPKSWQTVLGKMYWNVELQD